MILALRAGLFLDRQIERERERERERDVICMAVLPQGLLACDSGVARAAHSARPGLQAARRSAAGPATGTMEACKAIFGRTPRGKFFPFRVNPEREGARARDIEVRGGLTPSG